MSFTTVDSVKVFLGKETLTAMEYSQIEMLIGLIDGVISNYCGWNVLAADYTDELLDGNGGSSLDLKVYPVASVAKILVNAIDVTAAVTVNKKEGTLLYPNSSGTFTAGTQNISVTFRGGYEDVSIPADLTYAANYLVTISFNRIDAGNIGVKNEGFNNITVEYDNEDIPKLVKRVLDRYRRVSIY